MAREVPDPELVKAFGRAVRRNFEQQIARERAAADARRAAVLPAVSASMAQARAQGACGRAWL